MLEENAVAKSEERKLRPLCRRVGNNDGFGESGQKKALSVAWLLRRKGSVRMQEGSKNQLRNATAVGSGLTTSKIWWDWLLFLMPD